MQIINTIFKGEPPYCQICGYSECPQILNCHHIYPRREWKKQNEIGLPREKRYMVTCPNCHAKINFGLDTRWEIPKKQH